MSQFYEVAFFRADETEAFAILVVEADGEASARQRARSWLERDFADEIAGQELSPLMTVWPLDGATHEFRKR